MLLDLLFILILTGSLCTGTMAAHATPSAPAPAQSPENYTYTPPWLTLPPTPVLPASKYEGYAQVNNVSLWYGLYGAPLQTPTSTDTTTTNSPIVLLHGGRISSRWYGHLIHSLADSPSHSVIAIDTRGHGRSTDDPSQPLSYTQFANDVISLLDSLSIPKGSFIGWSDGAITALLLAMDYPERVDRIISYGANYAPDQVNEASLSNLPFGEELVEREIAEYEELNPEPDSDWELFSARVGDMQAVEPNWTERDFAKIPSFGEHPDAPMVLIAAGDHEEAIYHWVPREVFHMIPNSQLAILPGMSHFGPLQDPETFAATVISFLNKPR
ncbi:alpha/beta fold hydrolase [Aspergillus stella-maris]|uniref:alpha/beta fold hydrolase n=1 Tax=Aspergillus stella-maris TaxID=1810926 RepID=UPI003CCD33A6